MKLKGSYTVEAALLMGVLLWVMVGIFTLCFYIHNRTWYTAAAYEAAISGGTEGTMKNGNGEQITKKKTEEAFQMCYPGVGDLQTEISVSENKVSVAYEVHTVSAYKDFFWSYRGKGEVKIVKPVSFIRKVRMGMKIEEVFHAG